jgi:hypothetical protein
MASATEQFKFETFEINKDADWYNRGREGVGHWFEKMEEISDYCCSYEMNIFSPEAKQILKNGSALGPALFICDGGNKPAEVELISEIAKPWDVCLVHDHPHEIKRTDINWMKWSIHDSAESFVSLNTLFLCLRRNT